MGMNNGALGGSRCGIQEGVWTWGWRPLTGDYGWMPVHGLNNVGLLITTWGQVTASDRNGGWFYMDDGSRVADGSGIVGVYVEAPGMSVPLAGDFVTVTGISSCEFYRGKLVSLILPRSASDIVVATPPIGVTAKSDLRNPVNDRAKRRAEKLARPE